MLTHELTTLTPPRPAAGAMRFAEPSDVDLVERWVGEFRAAIGESNLADSREIAEQRVRDRQLALWQVDGTPVAMAGAICPTPNGIRIVLVYTPAANRGRGYASNLVAALTRHQLESGRRLCFLNADLRNPTANKIYRALGYRPVCESIQIMFDRAGGGR
jgi:predicted GNAT family acetyltransferase